MVRMGKITKEFFLDKGYYGNEGFSLDTNIKYSTQNKSFFLMLLMTSKRSYGNV